ncbi:PBSX family phage terminase large subunit [Faecalibacillus faecis]|uniref:PBSX family phage terminase large subunit n=1 Tax=Faecalibacillus faecis TaxID=1982628 RepID=UPI0018A9437B|nr:PBSX family phage terminase large subunit [Faecalibacillus faecis]
MKKIRAVFKFKPFSKKQRKVLNWWTDNSPVKDKDGIIADGSIRSGKTVSMSLSYVIWAMSTFVECNFGMCGKTIGSFRRNVLNILKLMLWSRGYKLKDHRADNMVEITKKGVTNYFYVFGGKDESSQDLIQGITLAGCFFDEVALMPESFVNQATARCSVEGSKWWFNCNPDGPFHWFKVNWIDKTKEKNIIYLHFTMDDNLSLSERIKQRYKSQWSGVFYDRYIKGLWTVAEGIIYDMFNKDKHIVEDCNCLINNKSYRYVSCDYGTQNAMVFLLWNKGTDGIWYCIDEYYYSGRDRKIQKTDSEYADDLVKFLNGREIFQIVVDPSAASFIAELKKRGFRVKKAKNDVSNGIRLVSTMLNQCKIKFFSKCKNTIKEFSVYAWDPKASARGEDAPIKQNDHAMDAIRYFIYTILKGSGLNMDLEGGI